MNPNDVNWKAIGMVISIVILIIVAITFITLYSKERKKNSSDGPKESDQSSEKIDQGAENENKVEGSGISYNCDMTIFKITDDILPIPNESIFEDDTIMRCVECYKKFITKEITKESEESVLKYSKILIQSNVIIKEFRDKSGSDLSSKSKLLRELYYDIMLKTKNGSYSLYHSMCSLTSRIEKTESKIGFCNDIIKNKSKLYPFISDPPELRRNITKYLKDNNDDNWKNVVTEFTKIDNVTLKDASNAILSTECLKKYKERYYSILGFSRDSYKRYINTFFSDVRFESSCDAYQIVNISKSPIIATGIYSIFSKDDSLRNWYFPEMISNISGIVKETDSEEFTTSIVNPNPDYKGFDHADIVPAAVINAVLQIFIIKFIANGNDINNESIKNDLFKFLLATRLNMTFINILANVAEEHGFNLHLSDSYYLEST